MKSPELKHLNFKVLFDFPQHFPPKNLPARHRYFPARKCVDFCIDCETKSLCSSRRPNRMSHGADTEDFEQALGKTFPQPPQSKFIDTPVMFLGIEPGGDYGNDELLAHKTSKKLRKYVPTKHYYWTPPNSGIPKTPRNVNSVPGPFFTYLIYRFGFRNAYFTNIVKCRLWDDQRKDKNGRLSPGEVYIKPDKSHMLVDYEIRHNCIKNYLQKEIMLHQPEVIFVLGDTGMKVLSDEPGIDQNLLVQLKHYGSVTRHLITPLQYVKECEQIITNDLVKRKIL